MRTFDINKPKRVRSDDYELVYVTPEADENGHLACVAKSLGGTWDYWVVYADTGQHHRLSNIHSLDLINTPQYEYRAEWVGLSDMEDVLSSQWTPRLSDAKQWLAEALHPRGIYRREVGCTDPSRWELVES
jgi:hypothetical protein